MNLEELSKGKNLRDNLKRGVSAITGGDIDDLIHIELISLLIAIEY